MEYSDEGFVKFIHTLNPNADDLSLNAKLNNNIKLAATLIEYTQQRTEERLEREGLSGNLLDAVTKLEALKLLDVFISGFTVGRYFEKGAYDELKRIVDGD